MSSVETRPDLSETSLPVERDKRMMVAAGRASGALGISRPGQENVEGYAERVQRERG